MVWTASKVYKKTRTFIFFDGFAEMKKNRRKTGTSGAGQSHQAHPSGLLFHVVRHLLYVPAVRGKADCADIHKLSPYNSMKVQGMRKSRIKL